MSEDQPKTPAALIVIERCILGALLTGTDITQVDAFVKPEMLIDPDNRQFFHVIQSLDEESVGITPITLAGRIDALKNGNDPMTYLSGCIHLHKNEKTFHLENYCYEIRINYASRLLSESLATAQKQIGEKKPLSKILRSIEIDVVEISGLEKKAASENLTTASSDSMQRMADAWKNEIDDGVPWGFEGLRIVADGNMQWGNFHALLLDSTGGKTSLALQIIRNAAEQGIPVLFISYEQDSVQCIRQMSSQRIQIESKRMRKGDFTEAEYRRIDEDHALIAQLPIEIVTASGWGGVEIAACIKRFRRKYGRGLVVIDHAKSMKLPKGNMFAEQINENYIALRDEIKRSEMAGLLLMQRRSSSIDRDNPEPIKGDAYGGDATNEPLDLLVGMWRPEQVYKMKLAKAKDFTPQNGESEKDKINRIILNNEGKAKLLCLKNRYGNEEARAEMLWEPQFTQFSDIRNQNTVNYEQELF